MDNEKQVLDKLSQIIDPDLGKDIVTLGFIKKLNITNGSVKFDLELTTPACPVKEEFRKKATELILELTWATEVSVNLTARPQAHSVQKSKGLQQVKNIVAVYSCKGGVGKSTVAVNLAYSLARTGAKVGIFDADIYGPSLPTMVQLEDKKIYQQDDLIVPLEHNGVKLMSFGYVNQSDEAAVMRGPMVSNVIGQLLNGTDWGELDYLVLDMPPGTGDIQLTIAQSVSISAAVMVTTPQNLSFVDVIKGIKMFDNLKVPTVAVVENMSYFEAPDGECYRVFGKGALQKLVDQFGFRNTVELPIVPLISEQGDGGLPVVVKEPNGLVAKIFSDLTASVVREISRIKFGGAAQPVVQYDEDNKKVEVIYPGAKVYRIAAADVRRACKCAHCVDEMTAQQVLDPASVPDDLGATNIAVMGNYAVSIHFSDGHTSAIFPYDYLKEICETK